MRVFFILFFMIYVGCSKSNEHQTIKFENLKIADLLLQGNNRNLPYNTRLMYADSAFAIIKQIGWGVNTKKHYRSLCEFYEENNQPKKLLKCAKTFEKLATKNLDTTSIETAQLFIGESFMHQSENDSAYYYLDRCIKSSKARSNNDILLLASFSLTELYYYICDYINVEKSALNILLYSRKLNNKICETYAYNWIAISANELSEFDKATEYYNRALTSNIDINYRIHTLHCKGFNFYKAGNFREAILMYEKALSYLKNPSQGPSIYARLIDDLAHANFNIKVYDSLPEIYYKAAKIRNTYNIEAGKNFNRLYLSEYFAAKGDTTKSIYYGKAALKISNEFKAPKDRLVMLKNLISVDKSNAEEYTRQYILLSDSLQLAERKNRNKFARIAFETDEITVEKERAVKQKWAISAIASAMLLLLTLLFIIKLQRAKQKELILIQHQQKADESIYQLINDQQLQVDEGRQAEKKRIARELHDGIMNRLASTRLNLFILNKSQDEPTIKKCIGFINNIQEIEKEIRQVAHDLNDEIFSENKGFGLLLENLFEDYRAIPGTRLFTEIDPAFNWEMTESVLRMNIYRMLQEALQNCFKYADAKNIFVTLTREGDFVRILVHDDGKGFDVSKVKKGMGLKSIGDRAASLKGEFKIISGSREGTILNILLPLSTKV